MRVRYLVMVFKRKGGMGRYGRDAGRKRKKRRKKEMERVKVDPCHREESHFIQQNRQTTFRNSSLCTTVH